MPATDVPVLVPWRTDHDRREAIWGTLRKRAWDGWTVIEGQSPDGPFNRSAALNDAARKAGAWDLAVIADADSFVSPGQLAGAITTARETGRLTFAFSLWVDVWPDEHDRLLDEGWLPWRDKRLILGHTVSSMLVVPRTVWDQVGGFDEHFAGWGCEDVAFARACKILTGDPERIYGTVWHLAHSEPVKGDPERSGSPEYRANRERWRLYRRATTPRQIRALLDEP